MALMFVAATLAALAPAPVGQAAGAFVGIQDAHQLGIAGRPWRVKAVQFWMTDYVTGPPSGWFNTWTAAQTEAYLEQARWEIGSLARENLGANTLRVFFPFGNGTSAVPAPRPTCGPFVRGLQVPSPTGRARPAAVSPPCNEFAISL